MFESDDILSDYQLTAADIGRIENHQQLIDFFAALGYDVNDTVQVDHAALGLDSADLRQRIKDIRLVGTDPVDGDLSIYLFNTRSVTLDLRRQIARRFRDRPGDYLLVLTSDYETLDFVLLERDVAKGKGLGKTLKQTIRPRSLTVNRRNPDPVHRRVLKRFTFTEEDSLYQWDKLRAAYDLAEWSEPNFNNRALFSDYYLNERLPEQPEWQEDVAPIGRQLHRYLAQARKDFSGQPESTVRRHLYEPLFEQLGFQWQEVKSGASSTEEPDYRLFDPAAPEDPAGTAGPIASVLTYVWDRSLDAEDTKRDPETPHEIPGAIVVSLLEKADTPWVVVTNGRLWRLYSATADNKATNYYEIDLEEAAGADDQLTALKYWWLFFRKEAFIGFLDNLLQGSQDYAKALGDRLKERVFTAVFPHFARGFVADLPTEDTDLDAVFQGTLTFLYRLMFVLFAESLDLLPLHEAHGYGKNSLALLKREIAKAGGEVEDEAAEKLRAHYDAGSYELYERLATLFRTIDSGNKDWNLPSYNGGLFSEYTEQGAFLAKARICDRDLALGLDRLCRDVDDKTLSLVFVDYKSLGVRQLGSIYEGLLEFKLRIALENLTVIKNKKGKEVYVPAAKAGKKPVYAKLKKGDIYLENDKRERKATGSYYTPDYIVKYIVEHTVGPVLEHQFAELEPRLRLAQKEYHAHEKRVIARGGDQPAALFWKTPEMRRLANDCLDIRVLDPAMGSGHFLVEAVDFISNRLIDFLNAWSHNPVWAMLEMIREDILSGMGEQGVTIDPERLTRVVLLKRAVLKRCVYGVDLNPMAVELAKVSLWLDAFTLGAPLSFLDHHLKCGNSLIGARIDEVREAVEGSADKAVQLSLFSGSAFTGLSLATDLMRQVSYLSDNTIAQVNESRDAYQDAADHLAYYKRVLDVYTSRWFGNEPSKKTDPTFEFIRNGDAREWLKDPQGDPPDAVHFDAAKVAQNAFDAVAEKRFFHWELEFPEIFFGPNQPDGQDIQLLKDGGFDAVIGNPPYDVLSSRELGYDVSNEIDFFKATDSYSPAIKGKNNLYKLFINASVAEMTRSSGYSGVIVPLAILGDWQSNGLRTWLLQNVQLMKIEAFPQKDDPKDRVFPEAKLSTCIVVLQKSIPTKPIPVRTHPGRDILPDSPQYMFSPDEIKSYDPLNLSIPTIDQRTWNLAKNLSEARFTEYLGTYYDCYQGEVNVSSHKLAITSNTNDYRFIKGSQVARYAFQKPSQGEIQWVDKKKYINMAGNGPKTKHHLSPRIVMQGISGVDDSRRLIATYCQKGTFLGHSTNYFVKQEKDQDLYFLLALLNSNLLEWRFRQTSTNNNINSYEVEALPVPQIQYLTSAQDRQDSLISLQRLYKDNDYVNILVRIDQLVQDGRLDVIHDVLVFLAQEMTTLNIKKENKAQEFLDSILKKLSVVKSNGRSDLSILSGYTIIQNYVGNYQTGQPALTWDDFYYRLHQNRSRFGVHLDQVKGEIQAEYEKSLAVLLPIKEQLAATDALIDKIVYQLYGLTNEEIALIEQLAYEKALANAKARVLSDEKLQKDTDAALDAFAGDILPAARRRQDRVNVSPEEARLDADLPGWRLFAGDVPRFLNAGEYDVVHRPDYLDFSGSVVYYAKAVEQAIMQRLFEPFRAAGYSADNAMNRVFKKYMDGERKLTLGNFPFILTSKEKDLAEFAARQYPVRGQQIFFNKTNGVRALLNDKTNIDLRNAAAHSEALNKEDARKAREWALAILRYL